MPSKIISFGFRPTSSNTVSISGFGYIFIMPEPEKPFDRLVKSVYEVCLLVDAGELVIR